MNNINEAIRSAKILVQVAEMAKERNELREELKALRKEVEELKMAKKEKPKEYLDLKIKWNHCELSIEENKLLKYLNLRIDDGRDEFSIPIEKPDAIKIVDYLKNHFEI